MRAKEFSAKYSIPYGEVQSMTYDIPYDWEIDEKGRHVRNFDEPSLFKAVYDDLHAKRERAIERANNLTGKLEFMKIARTTEGIGYVVPKPHWIEYPECLKYKDALDDTYIVCSECFHVFNIIDNCTEEFNHCPHCGVKLEDSNDN